MAYNSNVDTYKAMQNVNQKMGVWLGRILHGRELEIEVQVPKQQWNQH